MTDVKRTPDLTKVVEAPMNYCGDCGSRLQENAAFCGECGKGVKRTNEVQILSKTEELRNELSSPAQNLYKAPSGNHYTDYSNPSSINIVMQRSDDHPGAFQSSIIYDAKKKSNTVAYFLWLIFEGLGVHRFYIHRPFSAVIMLSMFIFGFVFSFIFVGIPFFILVVVWWVLDAALIPGMVRSYNLELAQSMGY